MLKCVVKTLQLALPVGLKPKETAEKPETACTGWRGFHAGGMPALNSRQLPVPRKTLGTWHSLGHLAGVAVDLKHMNTEAHS